MPARHRIAAAVFLLASIPMAAHAQTTGFAADRFDPSERGSEWFVMDSLDMRGHVRPAIGVVADYAHRPLVVYNADGSQRAAILSDQMFLHLGGSVVFWDRLRLALNLPIAPYQS